MHVAYKKTRVFVSTMTRDTFDKIDRAINTVTSREECDEFKARCEESKAIVCDESICKMERMNLILNLAICNEPGAHVGFMAPCVRPSSKDARCCVCSEKATGRCSQCEMVFYCSEEHQNDDHKNHRAYCRLAVKCDPNFGCMHAIKIAR
jgi:hypothetical protein